MQEKLISQSTRSPSLTNYVVDHLAASVLASGSIDALQAEE